MQLRVLGSSSSGNCYLLENEAECLVLEAGLPFRKIKEALTFDILKIVGVLVTHEHGDHAAYAKQYVNAGLHVAMSEGTSKVLSLPVCGYLHSGYWYQFGGFSVTPFSVIHDAAEPIGFIIQHEDMGTLLFASDTEYIKQTFKKLKLNHIMIECNYSQKIIDSRLSQGETLKGLRDRVLQSHMELGTCKEFICANATAALDTITLLHLSDGNSNAEQFRKEIQEIHPFSPVYIADEGLTVNLNIIPF